MASDAAEERDAKRYANDAGNVIDEDAERGLRAWPSTRDDEIQEAVEAQEEGVPSTEKGAEQAGGKGVAKVFSRRSMASSWKDPGPAPDGGTAAWIQVLCTHITIFNTFGFFTSFGVFQTYYQTTLGIPSSTISWIGSLQVFLLFAIGTFTGRATDAGYFRHSYITGAVFQVVGVFTMAESTKLWQLFLSQALCLGISNGLQFCPAMALVSTYFVKRRAFALGVTALGSCTGGIIMPVIVQQCLPRIGFPWTIRIIGFIMTALNVVAIALFRTRLPPRRGNEFVDWASFRELPYALFCASMFFNFWGRA